MTNTNIPIRPLSSGIVKNLPSQALPEGAVLDAGNFNITTNGLKSRGGFSPLIVPPEAISQTINDQYDYVTGDVQNTFLFQQNSGETELLTITNEALYKIKPNSNSYERISFKGSFEPFSVSLYDTDKIEILQLISTSPSSQSAAVDLNSTLVEPLKIGDYIRYGNELGIIYDIESDDTYHRIRINVDNSTLWDGITVETLYAELNFNIGNQYKVDSAFVNGISTNSIVFTTNRGLALTTYGASGYLEPYGTDSTSTVDAQYDIVIESAKATRWFKNRLWIANTEEDGGRYRQRVRWSDATTYLNLDSAKKFRPENYVDLADSMGEVLAIYPMGEIIVVYCSDAIYYGRQSNYTGLPYAFNKINTPNIGLVGQSAITPWIDGHYFVGQDDIYFLSAAQSVQPIGSPVLKDTVDTCFNKAGIDVRPDPTNNRIVFLFPEDLSSDLTDRDAASKLYTFNYKTGAWSYLEAAYEDTPTGKDYKYHFGSISSSMLYSGHTSWQDYIDAGVDTWTTWKAQYSTWDSLKDGQISDNTFLFGLLFRDSSLVVTTDIYTESTTSNEDKLGFDALAFPVQTILESADYDFDIPDDNKQVNRFSLKLEDHVSVNTIFGVEVSTDRGYTYKPVSDLAILVGKDEGKANFRAKGSTFRFRVKSDSLNINTINEFVIRLSKRGKEI